MYITQNLDNYVFLRAWHGHTLPRPKHYDSGLVETYLSHEKIVSSDATVGKAASLCDVVGVSASVGMSRIPDVVTGCLASVMLIRGCLASLSVS